MLENKVIGKMNDKSSYPQTFYINNTPLTDKVQIAEGFNNYFSNIGLLTSRNVPISNKCFTSFMPQPLEHSIFLGPVAPIEVLNLAKKLKSNLALAKITFQINY